MKSKRIRLIDTPRRDSARRGTEIRTLLRSRTVQTLLLTTAVAQTVAIAGGGSNKPAAPAPTRPSALTMPVAPVAATLAPRVARPAPRPQAAAAEARKPREGASKARQLAAKYRSKGYRVPSSLAEQIVDAALQTGIEPEVAFGLVATESGFQRTARSHVGAIGLAQLMPATARWLEPGTTRKDLEHPQTNLRLGLGYLRDLIEKYDGDTELALTAYNRGPGTVDRVLRRGGDPDNGYAGKVLGSE